MSQSSLVTTPHRLTEHAVRFSGAEIEAAYRAWKCTCGPVALACILGLTLDEVRRFIGPDYRGWMNPTQMRTSLVLAGVKVVENPRDKNYRPEGPRQYGCPIVATYGITRIQFGGPWTEPGVPPSVAYHHTHWVASATDAADGCADVFDNNWGWMSFGAMFQNMNAMAKDIPRASGAWWPTHIYEISFPSD